MKKIIAFIAFALMIVSLSACSSQGSSTETSGTASKPANSKKTIKAIELSQENLDLFVGDTAELSYTIYPKNVEYDGLMWKSENEDIATVDQNGTVTGVSAGETNIIISVSSGVSNMCKVTVSEITTYDTLNDKEKEIVDTFLRVSNEIGGYRETYSLTYAYKNEDGSWEISVYYKHKDDVYSIDHYHISPDGELIGPTDPHEVVPGWDDGIDMDKINTAIFEKLN